MNDVVTAMDLSRRAEWRIRLWARDLGKAHELGEYRGSYRALRPRPQWTWGVMVIMLTMLGLVPAVAATHGSARVAVGGVAGVLVALGVVLIKTTPRQKVDWAFWYADGIAQVADGEPTPRVIHWPRLAYITREFSEGDEGDPHLTTIRVVGADGTMITVDAGHLGSARLDREIGEAVAGMRLRGAIEQCDRGAPVRFGDLAVSQDGVTWDGGEYAAWRDIRSIRVLPHEIRVADGWKPISLNGVPDACVAVPLIQELAVRQGVQLTGDLAASALSAGEHARPPASTLLSEADVSQVLGWPMRALVSQPRGVIAVFRGDGVTVSLKLRRAVALDRVLPRRLGRAVPGIGDEAWLLFESEQVLVARVGTTTMQVRVEGLPPTERAAVVIRFAQLAAARLAVQAAG